MQGEEIETYHVLQKGYIQIAGKTNFFEFKGSAIRHRGRLEEAADGLYSGEVSMKINEIDFDFPGLDRCCQIPSFLTPIAIRPLR